MKNVELMPRKNTQRSQNREPKDRTDAGFIPESFINYYKKQLIPNSLTDSEFDHFIELYKTTLPHVFRISPFTDNFERLREELNEHIKTLKELNYDAKIFDYFEPKNGIVCMISISKPELKKKPELDNFRKWLLAHTDCGDITRQEFVSMLPPFFLDVQPDDDVLDTCAAPGSKTTQILECLKDGSITANDSEIKRCNTLIHQLHRLDSSKTLIINHPAQFLPNINLFDKVLCDVPCSGDGTFRKNPDASEKWNLRNGLGLHSIQRSILIRGLELLKIGGTCVYSTCSLNPIEDEAVINSVINELNGAVEIVDCSNKYPKLIRSNGIKDWSVYLDENKIESLDKVPEEYSRRIKETMFPKNVVPGIEHCLRFYPHQNNTGGFFICVLRKLKDFNTSIQQTQSKPKPWKERPFIPLLELASGKELIEKIKEDYGLKEDFDPSHLYTRSDPIKNIFYLSDPIIKIVKNNKPSELRAVTCGTRLFTIKTFSTPSVTTFPCFESINLLYKFATKRIINVTIKDFYNILKSNIDGYPFSEFETDSKQDISSLNNGGVIIHVQNTNLNYSAMKAQNKIVLQVNKERIQQELIKLHQTYPDLIEI